MTLKEWMIEESKDWEISGDFFQAQSIANCLARYSKSTEACIAIKQADDLFDYISAGDYIEIIRDALRIHQAHLSA